MRNLPIAFSQSMVQALLAGRKTETRRVLNPQPIEWQARVIDIRPPSRNDSGEWGQVETVWNGPLIPGLCEPGHEKWHPLRGVRYAVGDRLYVREEIEAWKTGPMKYLRYSADQRCTFYSWPEQWKRDKARPMHMFRQFSRMTLPVTDVRVERLHDITDVGAIAEGVVLMSRDVPYSEWHVPGVDHPDKNFPNLSRTTPREMYAALWDVINGSGAWLSNPWVMVTGWSHVIHQNIDRIAP